jgi:hypothetical protein
MPTYELTIDRPHLRDVVEHTVTAEYISDEGDLAVFRDVDNGLVFAVRRHLLLTVERLDEPEPDAMATDGAACEAPAEPDAADAPWQPPSRGTFTVDGILGFGDHDSALNDLCRWMEDLRRHSYEALWAAARKTQPPVTPDVDGAGLPEPVTFEDLLHGVASRNQYHQSLRAHELWLSKRIFGGRDGHGHVTIQVHPIAPADE